MIEIRVLGSGSRGNATLFRVNGTGILVDAGLSARQVLRRLDEVGQDPRGIEAIVLTHEHRDHVGGVRVLARRLGIPVLGNARTLAAAAELLGDETGTIAFETGRPFQAGPFAALAFPVPHDAAEPVGFLLSARGVTVGYATDLGYVTRLVAERLAACRALVFEANHDPDLLMEGPYPWPTKQRVASRVGHLSNGEAAEALARFLPRGLAGLVLAHLSETNNRPDLAAGAVRSALERAGKGTIPVIPASQHAPAPPVVAR